MPSTFAKEDAKYEFDASYTGAATFTTFRPGVSRVHGLQTVAADTGGFFSRMFLFPEREITRVAEALVGHYVLFVEKPETKPGVHRVDVRLIGQKGTVYARGSYVD